MSFADRENKATSAPDKTALNNRSTITNTINKTIEFTESTFKIVFSVYSVYIESGSND